MPYDFFASYTIEELARMQGVDPLADIRDLAGVWPDEGDEDVDEFLACIYENR